MLKNIESYKQFLYEEEKSTLTIQKYISDILAFYDFIKDVEITKEKVIQYKQELSIKYQISTINSKLISIHRYLDYIGLPTCKVKLLKMQRKAFIEEDKELSRKEYQQLLNTAKNKKNRQLYILLQTICSTGIRVSEHCYITVESLEKGKAQINNKGKVREIYYPKSLKKILVQYCQKNNLKKGAIFVTKNGKPLNRSNIWKSMKRLCKDAQVDENKVFPHNLRHLFAITYYKIEKDIVRLADILGHSSVDTTRIYTKTTSFEYQKKMKKMNLVYQN